MEKLIIMSIEILLKSDKENSYLLFYYFIRIIEYEIFVTMGARINQTFDQPALKLKSERNIH